MVNELRQIIENRDFSSEEDMRKLVFICANNPHFELPFALLTRYPVFETYAEYWEKGAEVIRRNSTVSDQLVRTEAEARVPESDAPRLSRAAWLSFQKKAIKKYLKQHSDKRSY